MNKNFKVSAEPRRLPPGVQPDVPLVTTAWRAMRQDHQRHAREKQALTDEIRMLSRALCLVAQACYRLRPAGSHEPAVQAASKQIAEALKLSGVTILAPQGEPYTPALMECIENIAQRRESGLLGPVIAEIVAPAVLRGEALLQMGQAVIAVPATPVADGAAE